jgi:hypothetical protein
MSISDAALRTHGSGVLGAKGAEGGYRVRRAGVGASHNALVICLTPSSVTTYPLGPQLRAAQVGRVTLSSYVRKDSKEKAQQEQMTSSFTLDQVANSQPVLS